MEEMEFFATCSRGFERALANELRAAGVHGVRPLNAGVSFHGGLKDAYLALLWSRVASRVLLTLGRIDANNADALYEGVYALPWDEHLAEGKTLAVSAHGTNDKLRDTRFTGVRTKDAIVDKLRDLRGVRPSVDPDRPDVSVNVLVNNKRATISIDLTGAPLERRGYRPKGAPMGVQLRENLAAALLLEAGWKEAALDGAALLNPLCGNGVMAVEAALIAGDIAPGIQRGHWGFEGWAQHDEQLWNQLLDEADARAAAAEGKGVCIVASDPDEASVEYARTCARRAGVANLIDFSVAPLNEQPKLPQQAKAGMLASNISYGGQITTLAQLPVFYAQLVAQVRSDERMEKVALICSDDGADAAFGGAAAFANEAKNGPQTVLARVYDAQGLQGEQAVVEIRDTKIEVIDKGAQQFASRLNRVIKLRRKWAKANNVHAYRVYDSDLPDFNMAIDIYEAIGKDAGQTYVHVSEYAAPKKIDPAKTARRMADALRIMPVVLEVDPSHIFVKRRVRAKGGSQYSEGFGRDEQQAAQCIFNTVENGLKFEINLSDYLDTGLFLDHRDTRRLLAALAKDKSFLNLFAYTGTASVYAAVGGAKFTTTVDMSNTYLEWAKRNMELNGLMNEHREWVRADVLQWVQEQRHTRHRWDLIFVDPPTFSSSTKMGKRTWDVQRDHAELLIGVSRLLTRGGAIVFSCNYRGFKPDVEKLQKAGVVINDITARTIPEDFERSPKIHSCYVLRRA